MKTRVIRSNKQITDDTKRIADGMKQNKKRHKVWSRDTSKG
ncbi:hypothetical protein T03_5724 [Trichinella britovi]|uniref:Uncharacterized protein n=1 Tax=Trichinella britovi TaxID=45882 RepID=A0A0V1AJP6_TRIBR|nr:hypothetical protein T03_5724 [Trichinella britovi]KRZ93084.1 hypothetical protein T08_9680 [Trichinella sp. T8]